MIQILINSLQVQLTQCELAIQSKDLPYQYLSLEIPLQEIPFSLIKSHSQINDSFFLSRPNSDSALLGLGALLTIKSQGKERLEYIKSQYAEFLRQCYAAGDQSSFVAFLAFAFDENDPMSDSWSGFPNTLLTIPALVVKQSGASQTLIVNIKATKSKDESRLQPVKDLLSQLFAANSPVANDNHMQAAQINKATTELQQKAKQNWDVLAKKAINQIRSGSFNKLVTSRQLSLQCMSDVSTTRLLTNLEKHYPSCTIFSYRHGSKQSEKNIIAASPERLVTLHDFNLQSDALGGTILRTPLRQEQQASNSDLAQLPFFLKHPLNQTESERSESQKLLKEHNYISQNIYQKLDPLCHSLKMPLSPYLMKLHHLYHLETPIKGKLMTCYNLFDVIKALHPTPAVAGLPTPSAQQWLSDNENYQRGWYTGVFGWLDNKGNGDLSVMLRCTLISRKSEHACQPVTQLDLFAGAGLVAESTPDAEWQETELKMKTILEML